MEFACVQKLTDITKLYALCAPLSRCFLALRSVCSHCALLRDSVFPPAIGNLGLILSGCVYECLCDLCASYV